MISKENIKIGVLLLLIISSAYAGYLYHEQKNKIEQHNKDYEICNQELNISIIPNISIHRQIEVDHGR